VRVDEMWKSSRLGEGFLVMLVKCEELRVKDALVTMCPWTTLFEAELVHGGVRVGRKAFQCRVRLRKIHRMRRRWRPRVDLRRCPGY